MGQWVRKLLPLASLSLVFFLAVSAAADTSASANVEIGWKVMPYQSLTISDKAGSWALDRFEIRQPTGADLRLGYIEVSDAATLVAASNIPWSVKVHAVETSMGRSTDGTTTKPLSDFSLRANNGSYTPISTADQTLAYGGFGVTSLAVDYRIKTDPQSYRPGDYGLTLVYTITTQD